MILEKFVFFFLRVYKNVTKTNVLNIESGNQQRKQSNRIGIGGCWMNSEKKRAVVMASRSSRNYFGKIVYRNKSKTRSGFN